MFFELFNDFPVQDDSWMVMIRSDFFVSLSNPSSRLTISSSMQCSMILDAVCNGLPEYLCLSCDEEKVKDPIGLEQPQRLNKKYSKLATEGPQNASLPYRRGFGRRSRVHNITLQWQCHKSQHQ